MVDNREFTREEEFLKNYKPEIYERPSVTVDMLLFTVQTKESEDIKKLDYHELKVLLIKRNGHPYKNYWAVPGGFVGIDEDLETSVERELKEETNVDNVYLEQLYTWGDVSRDPRMRVISTSYMALVNSKNIRPKAGDDAGDVAWFTVSKEIVSSTNEERVWYLTLENEEKNVRMDYKVVDRFVKRGIVKNVETDIELLSYSEDKLAFDHYKIVNMGLDRLRNKVEYTPIIYNLMPAKFTLSNLQQVYEILLNKKFENKTFKRQIKNSIGKYIEELDEKQEGKGFKPATLYRYNGYVD